MTLLKSKAEMLETLEGKLQSARILPQVRFSVSQWKGDENLLERFFASHDWMQEAVIVRSSAAGEDVQGHSLAGHYKSLSGVKGVSAIREAVEEVMASYQNPDPGDVIFIQPEMAQVQLSGVAFTVDPTTGSPYYVINYAVGPGCLGAVTGGNGQHLETFYLFKHGRAALPQKLAGVVLLLQELERHLKTESLDIEFALSETGELVLFQVRALEHPQPGVSVPQLMQAVNQIKKKISTLKTTHPYLYGKKTLFGTMPDWNPAEMIGVRPSPLALSLYKELITDSIWAYQRDNYGYQNVRSFPLLVDFEGQPFIDVRVSFNSFLPKGIHPALAEKLISFYLEQLEKAPACHDKVEFEILETCYTLDMDERLSKLRQSGFTESECGALKDSLRDLTNRIIHEKSGLWKSDAQKIELLESRIGTILSSELDVPQKIYWLLEDCKRYGTLPFAGLARAGFIAVQLLKSLVRVGILTAQDYARFLATLDTVSSNIAIDFAALPRDAFLTRYGHLRPGTYNILSPRYDQTPDLYFNWQTPRNAIVSKECPFSLTLGQLREVESYLKKHGLQYSALGLFDFIKAAIEGREQAKFVFTKSVSEVLTLVAALCAEHGLDGEMAAFLSIDVIKQLVSSSRDVKETLLTSIQAGKERHAITRNLILPPLITGEEHVDAFFLPVSQPNFVTQKKVTAPLTRLSSENGEDLTGKIILMEQADPGYDWIFSRGIAGFITLYGGANSHMAIRAAELSLPAAIGVGEARFNQYLCAVMVEMDCLNQKITVIR